MSEKIVTLKNTDNGIMWQTTESEAQVIIARNNGLTVIVDNKEYEAEKAKFNGEEVKSTPKKAKEEVKEEVK